MKTTIEALREIAEVLGKNDEVADTIPDMLQIIKEGLENMGGGSDGDVIVLKADYNKTKDAIMRDMSWDDVLQAYADGKAIVLVAPAIANGDNGWSVSESCKRVYALDGHYGDASSGNYKIYRLYFTARNPSNPNVRIYITVVGMDGKVTWSGMNTSAPTYS